MRRGSSWTFLSNTSDRTTRPVWRRLWRWLASEGCFAAEKSTAVSARARSIRPYCCGGSVSGFSWLSRAIEHDLLFEGRALRIDPGHSRRECSPVTRHFVGAAANRFRAALADGLELVSAEPSCHHDDAGRLRRDRMLLAVCVKRQRAGLGLP